MISLRTVSTLERELVAPLPIDEVFAFFADPANLARLTPPWLHFRILGSSTDELGEGTTIDYRLRLHGLPLRWRSLISHWKPPYHFVDEQVRGPYTEWVHAHEFEETPTGTLVRDRVRFRVPPVPFVERLLVRPDVERIFDFRTARLRELLAAG
jgi:ligand-binding SRPBCC domain-containing protein